MLLTTEVRIASVSAEDAAYRLFNHISHVEKKALNASPSSDWTPADRKWILDTFAECIRAVTAPLDRLT